MLQISRFASTGSALPAAESSSVIDRILKKKCQCKDVCEGLISDSNFCSRIWQQEQLPFEENDIRYYSSDVQKFLGGQIGQQ